MTARYAVVVGEALVDLLEMSDGNERCYREMVGGAALNVAVGVARLGHPVEFVASLSEDVLGGRIRELLATAGVGTAGCVPAGVPTTLALTTFDGVEPDFHFYGAPPSYSMLAPEHIDPAVVAAATALYCGSITLLERKSLAAARKAWATPGPLRALDPNVRPRLTRDPGALRATVEEFAATADLVKLSAPDAAALYDSGPGEAARWLLTLGASAVVVTRGAQGALIAVGSETLEVPAPPVTAVDTTGAGDATMAGLLVGLLTHGRPDGIEGWARLVRFAISVGSLVCESPGAATAMPAMSTVLGRFPGAAL
jgi:sugar/nucleoside kinase (ribokinase family)